MPHPAGQIVVDVAGDPVDLAGLDPASWRRGTAWLPQRPVPTQATVGDEVRLGDPGASASDVAAACEQCRAPHPDTPLGEDGRSVSAGQRRRIALARVLLRVGAVERDGAVPLVLLDEPSEDLDHRTEQVVADVIAALAGRATVLIATHSRRLADLADRRITLVDGSITGSRVTARAGGSAEPALPAVPEPVVPEPVVPAPTVPAPGMPPIPTPLRLRDLAGQERLRRRLASAGAVAALAGISGLALTATSLWLISRAAQHPNVQALAIAVVGVRTFALGRALLRYVERLTAHDVALRLLVGLRAQVFAALRPLGPSALGGYRRGDLLRRFVGDVDGLQDGLVRTVLPVVGAAATSVAACVLAGLLAPEAGVVLAVALAGAGGLVPWLVGRCSGDADRLAGLAGRRDERSSALVDGLAELTAYGSTAPALREIGVLDADVVARSRRPAAVAAVGAALSGLLAAAALPAVLVIGAGAVRAGRLPAIDLGVLAICVLIGFEAVAPLPSAFASWTRCRAGLSRVAAILAAVPAFTDPGQGTPAPNGRLGLDVRGVTLRPAPEAPAVLRGAALAVQPGTRVALMGPSGCGKSTLLAATLRLLRADSGSVELTGDGLGVELALLRADDMPSRAAGSLQGDHVFDASLRDNLRVVRPDATDSDLDAVAARCGLSSFVAELPAGWATPAGVDGGALSGGQRQRLLLARALLADPHILVLDEPTAHLDADTEREVLADLLDATAGRTVLLSTHRRLAPGAVDVVARIEAGAIAVDPADRVAALSV